MIVQRFQTGVSVMNEGPIAAGVSTTYLLDTSNDVRSKTSNRTSRTSSCSGSCSDRKEEEQ